MLIAHDAHYAIDVAGGRMGLLYSRRRETHPSRNAIQSVTARLHSVLQCALQACRLLEAEPSLQGRVKFRGDEMLLRVNDRLVSPTLDAFDELQSHICGQFWQIFTRIVRSRWRVTVGRILVWQWRSRRPILPLPSQDV